MCPDCKKPIPAGEAIYDDGYKSCWDCYVKHCASKGQIVMMDEYFITPLSMYKEML
jgi:hypothetical protein